MLSRCFSVTVEGAEGAGGGSSSFIAQVPLGDMLNHCRLPDVGCRFDGPRRALFAIYYAKTSVPGRDLRQEYYLNEAENRRNRGSGRYVAGANVYHTGEPAWPSWSGVRTSPLECS